MRSLKAGWKADAIGEMGSSIFSRIFGWKEEALRLGREMIDLSIGTPDLPPAPEIRRALSEAALREDAYRYPGTRGSAAFRRQAADWMRHRFGADIDPDSELLPLSGSQDGLAHLAQAICNPGDLALIPDPGYPIYAGALKLAGVRAHLMPLRAGHGFLPELEAVPDEVWARASFILVSFPGNPVAARADEAYLTRLLALARKWNVLIVHDLAYSELGFDGYRPLSILALPGAKEQAVELHSCSKSFNMPGCRVGFIAGCREAVGALRELKGHIDFGVFEPVQEAAIEALRLAMEAPAGDRGVAPLYERRRDVFAQALAKQGWAVPKPPATMFLWAELPERFRSGGRQGSASRFAGELLLATGVAVVPGEAFGAEGEGFVRIALVREEAALLEAARRIGRFIRGEI
ncbi:aminotransferase class I/II-fold pyridoxal phosphate-dependent enzyme [Saccharibacillus sp. CPCC 101409]|nr:aminotransferase class I/II-fold pyridoxal phosphate-dependent enzyme [Saccharibacillus sp. CPCC 101409]MDO3412302.1 aminotransferase class I/II-fold pyridoxal phosphate-dependent enzyme [Saccharibacillus sp. CPCC 101409]